ncbi:PilZ domain-containing protein [Candidatus Sumerlaeota bacterium]|nr:PilZ domain-containing protein [Candidatus Sumerlaeota bacterium]
MSAATPRKKSKKGSKPVEKRLSDRKACRFRVTYTILSPRQTAPFTQGTAFTQNISESGINLLVDQEILTPTLIQINFNIPTRPFHLLTLAKVVQCKWNDEAAMYQVGLRFVGILSGEFKQTILRNVDVESPETAEAAQ